MDFSFTPCRNSFLNMDTLVCKKKAPVQQQKNDTRCIKMTPVAKKMSPVAKKNVTPSKKVTHII